MLKVRYNAPVSLSFTLAALAVLILDMTFLKGITGSFFTLPSLPFFSLTNPLDLLRCVTYVIGHADWGHFFGNFSLILLLGPILEEKYSGSNLLIMILITAVVTALINLFFINLFGQHALLGASGIVFMMILLVSFTNIGQGEIPLTFILIVLIYVSREVVSIFSDNSISEAAHILGGVCGSLFGFWQIRGRD